jgi:hypothetical protein
MTSLITVSLLLVFSVALVRCLLNVLRDLFDRNVHEGPVFQDPGPIFHDQGQEHSAVRSQFAWQSRSHGRGPD